MGVAPLPALLPSRPPQTGVAPLPPSRPPQMGLTPPPPRLPSRLRQVGKHLLPPRPPLMGVKPLPPRLHSRPLQMGARRCYHTHSPWKERIQVLNKHWKDSMVKSLNLMKDQIPRILSALHAALETVVVHMKGFGLTVLVILWGVGRHFLHQAMEGGKSKVNELYLYMFLATIAWCSYRVGEKMTMYHVWETSDDGDHSFGKMMESIVEDPNGLTLALCLKMMYQLSRESTEHRAQMITMLDQAVASRQAAEEARDEVEAIRRRNERTIATFEEELSHLKECFQEEERRRAHEQRSAEDDKRKAVSKD